MKAVERVTSKTNMILPSQNLEWWKQVTCDYVERDIITPEEIQDDRMVYSKGAVVVAGVPIHILDLFLACGRTVPLYPLLSEV